jgi:hypothetical protein
MSIAQLQEIVSHLPADELASFARWFEEFLADLWDQQIEADALAGRLDAVAHRADEDFEAGRCTPLP